MNRRATASAHVSTARPRSSRSPSRPRRPRRRSERSNLQLYLQEIGKTALLTIEEEITLAKRIRRGDKAARDHMIKANLRLVVKIAMDYKDFGLPLLDLISEGNIGLVKAVERFDPRKGGKLSTYAAWWIKQSIKRALANQSKTIRLPVHLVDKISQMRKTAMQLSERLGREPTDEELARGTADPDLQGRPPQVRQRAAGLARRAHRRGKRLRHLRRDRRRRERHQPLRQPARQEPQLRPPLPWSSRSTSARRRSSACASAWTASDELTLEEVGETLQRHPRAHPPARIHRPGQDAQGDEPARVHPHRRRDRAGGAHAPAHGRHPRVHRGQEPTAGPDGKELIGRRECATPRIFPSMRRSPPPFSTMSCPMAWSRANRFPAAINPACWWSIGPSTPLHHLGFSDLPHFPRRGGHSFPQQCGGDSGAASGAAAEWRARRVPFAPDREKEENRDPGRAESGVVLQARAETSDGREFASLAGAFSRSDRRPGRMTGRRGSIY